MAQIPFPVPNSTTSFWRSSDLDPLDNYQSPTWPDQSDIVIVGGGYAGASLAYHLLEKTRASQQHSSIAVVEAREACSGATGRNGGHLKPDPFSRAGKVIGAHGKEAAEEVSTFETRHIKEVGDLVKRENIDCDFVVTRATDVCLYEKARDDIKSKLDRLSEAGLSGLDDVFFSSEKTAEGISGIKGAKGCVTHTAAHLWPYKLVLHLLKKAVDQDVNLQTHTEVQAVSPEPDNKGCWTVTTSRGRILAKTVIYATNGYSSALLPELKDKIVPVKGICSRIVSPKRMLLTNNYVLRFNDWEYDYLIPRSDDSIIVGGARRDFYSDIKSWFDSYDDGTLIDAAKHYFDGYMQRHFHGWEDSGAYTDKIWAGIMGYSFDGFPFIGNVPGKQGQYICAGFSGHGMPQVFLSAKAIASMIVDGTSLDDTDLPRLYRSYPERFESKKEHVSLTAYDAAMKQMGSMKQNQGQASLVNGTMA